MIDIYWQSNSQNFYTSFEKDELLNNATGGEIYNYYVAKAIREKYSFQIDPFYIRKRNESIFCYFFRVRRKNQKSRISIKDPFLITFSKHRESQINIGIIHHIDLQKKSVKFNHKVYFSLLERQLKKLDHIIVVSEYWKNYLQSLGCRSVKVIYNSFRADEFIFSDDEINSFYERYNFSRDNPIIYIGNASLVKGAFDVYNALKEKNFQFVMTGYKNDVPNIPVKHLKLDRRDYLLLLKVSSIVITASRMIEGWNRTAHEALLCKTPVIGTRKGGLEELLTKSNQVLFDDFNDLPKLVDEVLNQSQQIGNTGYTFVKKYNEQYFKSEWQSFIGGLISDNTKNNL